MINHQPSIASHQFFQHKNTHLQNIKKKERKKLSPEAREKRIAPQSLQMISKSQKERAQKVIPGGTKKKESSAKSLNDIKSQKEKVPGIFTFFFTKNGPGTFPSRFPSRFPGRMLCKIGTFSGFAALFLTANTLYSPVRKENPASRACGNYKTVRKGRGSQGPFRDFFASIRKSQLAT